MARSAFSRLLNRGHHVFLSEPATTPFDFNFQLPGGIRVRVSIFFWIAALVIGWGFIVDPLTGAPDASRVLLWAAAMFLSILVHELGHVLAFGRYGIASYIVLYHFGGLAIPDSFSAWSGFGGGKLDSRSQIVVSAAGPAAQLLLAAAVYVAVRMSGHEVSYPGSDVPFTFLFIDAVTLWGVDPRPIPNGYVNDLAVFILWPSIYWAILNLAPVYPLDGGQIARESFLLHDSSQGIQRSLMLSVISGAVIAVFGFMGGQTMLAVMFGMLAFGSYQMLQQYSGGGGFGGGFGGGGFGGRRGW